MNSPTPGSVLRLAVPDAELNARVGHLRNVVLLATALAFIPAALLAAFFARFVSGRVAAIIEYTQSLTRGNFKHRLPGSGRGELGMLATHLNETSERLQFMMSRLEADKAELEKLERVRKDFVINVSHELERPWRPSRVTPKPCSTAHFMIPRTPTKFLNIIRQNTERLTRLTADLLVLSRIELGQQKFKFASYSANRLIGDNADSMLPIAQRKGIELRIERAPENAEVFADAEAVHQVLTNLLKTPSNNTLTAARSRSAPAPWTPDSSNSSSGDTGMGIPPEDIARLFERFYRVDKARSRALGGTGWASRSSNI
ncbi:MAG: HAMP domain-containing protein [Acidobacteriota bacterium]